MNEAALRELGEYIAAALASDVGAWRVAHGELTIEVSAEQIDKVMAFLRDDQQCYCKLLIDICGVDYPERGRRFEVVYHVLSVRHNHRVRVKLRTDERTPVPSIAAIYVNAVWFEREAWDLYGILFADNPDLRRILTDYGFEGHPLRKDFPLTGYVEVRYDDERKQVIYEPVSLTQEFRRFDFMSPWEGVREPLPGDEKAEGGG